VTIWKSRSAMQVLAGLTLAIAHPAPAQQPAPSSVSPADTAAVIAWIRREGYPLAAGPNGVDLPPLARAIREARIIGMGESLHHTHELLTLRFDVLKAMVLRHGVRGLAMETGYVDALLLDDWLAGTTAAEPDFSRALPFVEEGNIEELRAALRWIHAHNQSVPPSERVRFFGIDLSMGGGTLSTPVHRVLAYLDQVDPGFAARSRAILEAPVREVGDGWPRDVNERYSRLGPDSRAALEAGLAALRETLQARQLEYVRRSSSSEFQRAARAARVAEQTLRFMQTAATDPGNPRDHALAENAAWALFQLRPGARMVVWAHNAHVQKQAIDVPAMQTPQAVPSMGQLLQRQFGHAYVAMGTAVGVYEDGIAADAGTVDGTLASAAGVSYLLRVSDVRVAGPVGDWLNTPRLMRFQGTYMSGPGSLAGLTLKR
jgi:erythromycin esterase